MAKSPRWYVVRAKPKQDARAEANLRRWGVETFAPRVGESRAGTTGGAPSQRVGLLFPSYMFARFDASEELRRVRLTGGVHSVIGFGEYATPVDESVIEWIKGRIDDRGLVRVDEPQPGDRVRIVTGPLASLEGVFERQCANDRVVVLLASVLSGVRVEMARSSVLKRSIACAS